MSNDIQVVFRKLLAYCEANNWAGYDPYDALNSEILTRLPAVNSRIPRIVLTQALKRSPVNLRRWLRVPKRQNAKAIALLLSALLKLPENEARGCGRYGEQLLATLIALRSAGTPYWCWGYSFPWQTRTVLVPAGAPNLVCTVFAANALLDVYELRNERQCLEGAMSAAEYLLNELYWCEGDSLAGFSYPLPGVRGQVHNANFLAAALLCRVWRHTREEKFLAPALHAARSSAAKQNEDGSWYYGEAPSQRWIDNFHSGYNLCALRSISRDTGATEFDAAIRIGFQFYREHFIREDGAARYFHDRTYPVDSHSVAQTIITLLAFEDLGPSNGQLAHSVYRWAMTHLWDDRGFFYYRALRLSTIRISYMRWSQAWMFAAISALLSQSTVADALPPYVSSEDLSECVGGNQRGQTGAGSRD